MSKSRFCAGAAALALLAACSDSPMGESDGSMEELVITEGAAAPVQAPRPQRPSFSDVDAGANLGGSVTTPVSLKSQSCSPDNSAQLVITYTVTGRQVNTATFKVNSVWTYNGAAWSGSSPVTVTVPPRANGAAATTFPVTVTVTNASTLEAGTSTLSIQPFDLQTTAPATLAFRTSTVTVHVAFTACPVVNTPPSLVLPLDMTVEATSSLGAAATWVVTANDAQDGDLTGSVSCTPASGATFAIGETTVNCSVTDNGGLSANGSFKIKVEDTTAPVFTSFPTTTVQLIAADINGAILAVPGLGIAATDVGGVSEPSTYACDYAAGTVLAIGSTTTVSCTATDARNNESTPSTFDVFVGLNVNATGFLPPLRMVAPFSSHKRGSTIPHKFLPPTYADGTPATDLAGDLRLVLKQTGTSLDEETIDANDYTAGSTSWRWDAADGHYIFNLKTGTSSPWNPGAWTTTVSYMGITLATTTFELRR